jgi:methyl-accepting chemotaxis protein
MTGLRASHTRSGRTIRGRLMATIVFTTLVSLLLGAGGFASLELLRARREIPRELSILAAVIAQNSQAALLFDDPTPAEEALRALSVRGGVLAAAIYRPDGSEFARYVAENASPSELEHPLRTPGHRFGADHLDVYREIRSEGETIGYIFVRSDTSAWTQRLTQYAAVSVAVLLAAALLSWAVSARLRTGIAHPLGNLAAGAAALAEGNLAVRVDASSDDEVGRLATAFNAMAASLRELVSRVKGDADEVKVISGTLESAGESMASEVERQERAVQSSAASIAAMTSSIREVGEAADALALRTSETSTSVTRMDASIAEVASNMDRLFQTIDVSASSVSELTHSISQVSGNSRVLDRATDATVEALAALTESVAAAGETALRCHEASARSGEEAERGAGAVSEAVQGMKEIRTSFHDIEDIVGRLAERSHSIGDVVKVIEDVVAQTNLLALNASIIAAQAGEQGRAFAVVARQVQNLADTTHGSAREIYEMVQDLQQQTDAAVAAVKRGASSVERGDSLTTSAGKLLRGIGESSSHSSQMTREIADATEVQRRDIAMLDERMAQVKDIVRHIARAMAEQDGASGEITRSVEQVRALGEEIMVSAQDQSKQSRTITTAVEEVAVRMTQIAQATTEQRHGREQIAAALEVFREAIEQGGQRADEIRRILETLSSRSRALDAEVGRFRL